MRKNLLFLFLYVSVVGLFSCSHSGTGRIPLTSGWKFMPGDDPEYASAALADSNWKDISPLQVWDAQGYADLDGYAWYRVHVRIPSSIRRSSYFKDSLFIFLGRMDDRDQTWINGVPLGQNGKTVAPSTCFPGEIPDEGETWNMPRKYVLSVKDPRIHWDRDNVIAVRVFDRGGLGGMYGPAPYIAMRDVADYLILDVQRNSFEIHNRTRFKKVIFLCNRSKHHDFTGILKIEVTNQTNNRVIYMETTSVTVPAGKEIGYTVAYMNLEAGPCLMDCSFKPEHSENIIEARTEVPYILTPPPPERPRINGARVYGARPGHDLLYRVPATGKRPLRYEAQGLPGSLKIDAHTGIISGKAPGKRGDYPVRFIVSNDLGSDTAVFVIKTGDLLALTPPMGWNSWNVWGLSVDAEKVKAAADAFIKTGLADHGWSYINIDDGWEAAQRLPDGSITGNEKFPDLKELSHYVHSKGLKLGIYSSPGPLTCGGYLGSYGHEYQDAETWANWGIDYVKYDWCSYRRIARDNSLPELQKPYRLMRKALDAVDRDIVYSLCQYGMGHVWEWGTQVGGNLWRTTGDITDTWQSMSGIGFRQGMAAPYASPGHWNDPDMLVVGRVGWGPEIRPSRLTPDEQYTHISLWSLLAAPLLIGCDLTRLDDFTMSLLTNDEVLAVDQDPLGKAALPVYNKDNIQYWIRPLADGSYAAGIFNLGEKKRKVTITPPDLGLESGEYRIRDLWRQKDLGPLEKNNEMMILPHGVIMIKITAEKP